MPGFDPFSPSAYGLAVAEPAPGGGAVTTARAEPGIARSAVNPQAGLAHVDNPLVWFGLLLAATAGFIGVSTSARIGPLRGAVSAGKT